MRSSVLLSLLLLSACTSNDIKPIEYYRLQAASEPLPAVLQVTVADYLQRPGLMVAQDQHGLRAASGHRWAEPLAVGVKRSLSTDADKPGQWPHILLHIDKLHGSLSGKVALEAHWRLRCGGQKVATEQRTQTQQQQARAGYKAMVNSQQQLLAGLRTALLESLQACKARVP
ncbi:MAG: PqiC family protein [Cellvibrionaceae bacterium]|nr:PqiC family protein [Cellvibrionaceae bacterium]